VTKENSWKEYFLWRRVFKGGGQHGRGDGGEKGGVPYQGGGKPFSILHGPVEERKVLFGWKGGEKAWGPFCWDRKKGKKVCNLERGGENPLFKGGSQEGGRKRKKGGVHLPPTRYSSRSFQGGRVEKRGRPLSLCGPTGCICFGGGVKYGRGEKEGGGGSFFGEGKEKKAGLFPGNGVGKGGAISRHGTKKSSYDRWLGWRGENGGENGLFPISPQKKTTKD